MASGVNIPLKSSLAAPALTLPSKFCSNHAIFLNCGFCAR